MLYSNAELVYSFELAVIRRNVEYCWPNNILSDANLASVSSSAFSLLAMFSCPGAPSVTWWYLERYCGSIHGLI